MYASSVSVLVPIPVWAWLAGVKVVSVCLLCTVGSRGQLEVHGGVSANGWKVPPLSCGFQAASCM